jgi:WD40 repeat protein
LKGHTHDVNSVALSSDGQLLISGSRDRTIKVWNWETKREVFTLIGHQDAVTSIATMGNILISVSDDNTLKVWDLSRREEIATWSGESMLKCCAIAPNGKIFVVGETSGRVHFLQFREVEKKG